jgi:AraC-like DNA-binding protein
MIQSFFDPGLWLLGYDYVALNTIPRRWNFPDLAAPHWRIYWHNTPGAALKIGKRTIPIRPDHLYVIPSRVEFGSIHQADCKQLYIHFQIRHPYTFTTPEARLRGPPIIILPLTTQWKHMVRRIIAAHNGGKTVQRQAGPLIRAWLEMLTAELMDHHLVFHDIDKRLTDAMLYCEQHLTHPVDNKKLAALMHLHPRSMLRLFKSGLGQSPQDYLRQLRLDRACWFLRFSDKPIKTIAAETGFCDRYHFTKVFTKSTGQSPIRFRTGNRTAKVSQGRHEPATKGRARVPRAVCGRRHAVPPKHPRKNAYVY